jgi:quercetin dioxygenase-like cupin family protein
MRAASAGESAVYLLAGSCLRRGTGGAELMTSGDAVYYPPRAAGGLRATSGGGALTLEVSAGPQLAPSWPEAPAHQSARPPRTGNESADEGRLVRAAADRGDGALGHGGGYAAMDVNWLVTDVTVNASGIALATSVFAAGGSHDLHRHPNAAEFFFVLSGGGDHLMADGAIQVNRGDTVWIPTGTWHGFRAHSGVTTRAVYGYLGAPSLEAAGYELLSAKRTR